MQRDLRRYIVEVAADPLRSGMTPERVLEDLVASYAVDGDREQGLRELAGQWGCTVDEVRQLRAEVAGYAAARSAPLGPGLPEQHDGTPHHPGLPEQHWEVRPRGQRMPEVAASWDATCTRLGDHSCIQSWAAGYLHAPGDLCRGCTRRLMDLIQAGEPDVEWHPGWYRRAGIPAAADGGDRRG